MTWSRAGRRLARLAGGFLLTLAAAGGGLCLVFAVLAPMLHLSIVLFSTGSMSPELPAGSVALVRELPATQVRPGDVVTVDRPGALPITHRIVASRLVGHGRVELVLRGDANAADDPEPYVVNRVRVLVAGVPFGANEVAALSSPLALGGATVGCALLVGWAFWPRRNGRARGERRSRRRATMVLLPLSIATAVIALPSTPARADEALAVKGGDLRLISVPSEGMQQPLHPGVTVRWMVGVSAQTVDSGSVGLGLAARGVLVPRLFVSVTLCDAAWSPEGRCPAASTPLARGPLADVARPRDTARSFTPRPPDGVQPIGTMPAGSSRWIAVDVLLESPASSVAAETSAEIDVWAWQSGDDVVAHSGPEVLSDTGAPALGWQSVGLAVVAIGAGVGAATLARARARRQA